MEEENGEKSENIQAFYGRSNINDRDVTKDKSWTKYWTRFIIFHNAPIVKIYQGLFYDVALVFLFGFCLIFGQTYREIWTDAALLISLLLMIFAKLRPLLSRFLDVEKKSLKKYVSSGWDNWYIFTMFVFSIRVLNQGQKQFVG